MSDIQFHRKMGIEPGKTLTDAILACDYPKGQHAKLLEEVEVSGKRVMHVQQATSYFCRCWRVRWVYCMYRHTTCTAPTHHTSYQLSTASPPAPPPG